VEDWGTTVRLRLFDVDCMYCMCSLVYEQINDDDDDKHRLCTWWALNEYRTKSL